MSNKRKKSKKSKSKKKLKRAYEAVRNWIVVSAIQRNSGGAMRDRRKRREKDKGRQEWRSSDDY